MGYLKQAVCSCLSAYNEPSAVVVMRRQKTPSRRSHLTHAPASVQQSEPYDRPGWLDGVLLAFCALHRAASARACQRVDFQGGNE